MNGRYHRRGHLRALLAPPWRHVREWSASPEYRAFQRYCGRLRAKERFRPGTVIYRGRPVRYVDTASFLSAWDEIFVNRIYEIPAEVPEPLLVDAGANIGLAPLFWSTVYRSFRYVGFEPDPDAAEACRQNLRAWGCPDGLRECAVTGCGGDVRFAPDHADGGRVTAEQSAVGAIAVPSVRLSSVLQEEVDLLKVDIEGAELGVLEEARACLPRVKRIFVEVHRFAGRPSRVGSVIKLLEDAGFNCVAHTLRGPEKPFLGGVPAHEAHDFLVNVFGVRLDAPASI